MKVVMGGIGTGGTGGTGAPPSAIKLEGRIGGTGGTGAPPSATNVLSCLKCGTGGTGAPPSATGRWIGAARDCPSCRGWSVEDTDGATRKIDANAARTKLLSF